MYNINNYSSIILIILANTYNNNSTTTTTNNKYNIYVFPAYQAYVLIPSAVKGKDPCPEFM